MRRGQVPVEERAGAFLGSGRVGGKASPSWTSDDARKEVDSVSKPGEEGAREEGEGWREWGREGPVELNT